MLKIDPYIQHYIKWLSWWIIPWCFFHFKATSSLHVTSTAWISFWHWCDSHKMSQLLLCTMKNWRSLSLLRWRPLKGFLHSTTTQRVKLQILSGLGNPRRVVLRSVLINEMGVLRPTGTTKVLNLNKEQHMNFSQTEINKK